MGADGGKKKEADWTRVWEYFFLSLSSFVRLSVESRNPAVVIEGRGKKKKRHVEMKV